MLEFQSIVYSEVNGKSNAIWTVNMVQKHLVFGFFKVALTNSEVYSYYYRF